MRIAFLAAAALALMSFAAAAQTPATTPGIHAAPADVAAAIARARSFTTMTAIPIVAVPGARVLAEHRTQTTPASLHEKQHELITVVDGSGTLVVGGTLIAQTRRNETNLSGTGIEGGTRYALEKGTMLFVPAGTAHYFAVVGPQGLTITTVYLPPATP